MARPKSYDEYVKNVKGLEEDLCLNPKSAVSIVFSGEQAMRVLSAIDQSFYEGIKSSLRKQLGEQSGEAVNFTLDKTLWSYVFDHLSTDIETNSYNRDLTILIAKGLRKQTSTPIPSNEA